MADWYKYKYLIKNKNVDYDLTFHFGGSSGSYLGELKFPFDAIEEIEFDSAFEDERLHGMELAKEVKVTFNVNSLATYGNTFLDNLFNGGENINDTLSIPTGEFTSQSVDFPYPNRLVIIEKDKVGNYSTNNQVIFDGVQKIEYSGKKILQGGNIQLTFICAGSWILQQMTEKEPYLQLNYGDISTILTATYAGIYSFNNYISPIDKTHLVYEAIFGSTTRYIEEIDTKFPDCAFGSKSIKDIITAINTVASVLYNAIIRGSGTFTIRNTDSENVFKSLGLFSMLNNATTVSNKTAITSYNARIKTAIFNYLDVSGDWEERKVATYLEETTMYDLISNLLNLSLGRGWFTYGSDSVILEFSLLYEHFSLATKNYSITSFTDYEGDIDLDYKPTTATNVLLNDFDIEPEEQGDFTFTFRKASRLQGSTNESNPYRHNSIGLVKPSTRGRLTAGLVRDSWVSNNHNLNFYESVQLVNGVSNNFYVIKKLHWHTNIKLSSTKVIQSTDDGATIPSDAPRKNGRSRYVNTWQNFAKEQQSKSGLHHVLGNALNEIYDKNTTIELIVDDVYIRDFGRRLNISNMNKLIKNYYSGKIPTNYNIVGIKSFLNGTFNLTLVSINV